MSFDLCSLLHRRYKETLGESDFVCRPKISSPVRSAHIYTIYREDVHDAPESKICVGHGFIVKHPNRRSYEFFRGIENGCYVCCTCSVYVTGVILVNMDGKYFMVNAIHMTMMAGRLGVYALCTTRVIFPERGMPAT